MSFVRWTEPHFKSDLTPGSVERHNRKQAREKALEEAYAVAEKRDGMRCRATGTHLVRGAADARTRLEHHHLVPRSLSRGRREDPANIICLSALAHDLVTKGWIDVEGTDGRRVLMFHWTALAKSRPLVIKRHNPQRNPREAK